VDALNFYRRCLQDAWRSSWDVANAWLPIATLLLLYGGARLSGYGETDQNPLAMAVAFVVAAWLAVFAVRLIGAPPRLYADLQRRVPAPLPEPERTPVSATGPVAVAPVLDIRLHDQRHESAVLDAIGETLPAARAYVARIINRGDKPVRRCQLFFGNPTHIQVVSGPFDLAPGQHRDLPVLRVIDQSDEPHALAYYLESETWQVAQGQAAWLPEPGRFKVKVLSADAPTIALPVELSCSTTEPQAWTLVEATLPAERLTHERAVWPAAGPLPAPELNAGD
jgi:hypothetical protein